MAANSSFRAEIHIDQGAGRGRSVGWPFGRLVISNDRIIVRSSLGRWIPERSASREAAGGVSVDNRLQVDFPVFRWRRRTVLRFENPASALFGISLMLPRRTQAIDQLRARGFEVTDRRT
jgi:hypothetical protein